MSLTEPIGRPSTLGEDPKGIPDCGVLPLAKDIGINDLVPYTDVWLKDSQYHLMRDMVLGFLTSTKGYQVGQFDRKTTETKTLDLAQE